METDSQNSIDPTDLSLKDALTADLETNSHNNDDPTDLFLEDGLTPDMDTDSQTIRAQIDSNDVGRFRIIWQIRIRADVSPQGRFQ